MSTMNCRRCTGSASASALHTTPLSLGQRHPRCTFALAAFILCTYSFLSSPTPHPRAVAYKANHDLKARLEREERKYRDMLPQRQGLITRFGPTPAQVVMYVPRAVPRRRDLFPPIYNSPHELDSLCALGDGGKWMCHEYVIYPFGIDSSYSFEVTLLQSTQFCEVWIYDSTKGEDARHHIPKSLRHRAHFGKLALGASDRHGPGDNPKTWTLKSLKSENSHSHIDFLQLDVEGWEWETFRGIIREFTMERVSSGANGNSKNATGWSVPEREGVLPFGQLQIELHVWNQRFQDFLEWWELLEVSGLRPFHHEINLVYANYNRHSGIELAEYSFLNIRGDNVFIKDYVPVSPDQEPDVRNIRHGPGPE
ncbi:hypothetical protein L226DRAFT_539990 [Lentinus tigrinus ALCF2SS1-7]|uniref:uncharacterized protein n=1 Tax=Lentinus tigrinus ALCF2SS1-7 TaxID=1328758 RepID=UPI0011661F76|nr:hypothetical protein L226DRAFT_539990 [Lentinus tigrinus ALCF2SS1-7]